MKKTKIVIAGGGFAGLYAANHLDKRLARRPDIEVTLISRENFILFTPMLHEVAAGDLSPGDIVNPLRRILRHVNVVVAEVNNIDLSAKKLGCVAGVRETELEFEFDHLLLAIGSETNFFDNAGIRDWAVTMKKSFRRRPPAQSNSGTVRRSFPGKGQGHAQRVAHVCYRWRRIRWR